MPFISCHVCPVVFILTLLCVPEATGLYCYNGTLTSLRFGDDPLVGNGPFSPRGTHVARLRCSMTIACGGTQLDRNHCGGDFGTLPMPFNHTSQRLVNCTGEHSMCFVRSWAARAKHAWLVQRGCYHSSKEDHLPRSLHVPMRAMSCKHERLVDAEYKVCLCRADWCNSARSNLYHNNIATIVCTFVLLYVL